MHARKLVYCLLPANYMERNYCCKLWWFGPASLLVRELNIRYVDNVCLSSYDHDNQRERQVLKRTKGDGEKVLS